MFQNNGEHLLWSHLLEVYKDDSIHELRRTKLTKGHMYLNSYSKMNVKLAAQVPLQYYAFSKLDLRIQYNHLIVSTCGTWYFHILPFMSYMLSYLPLQLIGLTWKCENNLIFILQTMSSSVAKVLKTFGSEDAQETAKFIELVDSFFDCFNTR